MTSSRKTSARYRRAAITGQKPGGRSGPVVVKQAHPLLLSEAERVRRPNERLVIVNSTTVRLVPE